MKSSKISINKATENLFRFIKIRSNKQVAVLAHCTPREARRLVEQARQEGEPICSCDNGYFIAETADELRRMLRKHYHQINTMIATAKGLEHALLEMSE